MEYQLIIMIGDWPAIIHNGLNISGDNWNNPTTLHLLKDFWGFNKDEYQPEAIAYLDDEETLNSFDQIPLAMYCEIGLITDKGLMSKIVQRALNG